MLVALLILLSTVHAAPKEPPTPEALAAEARRVSGELSRSAQKGNWVAVEKHYQAALATGSPLDAAVHAHAAEAARTRGDLGLTRDRLLAALAVDPGLDEARASVEDLDRRFGRVDLKAPIRSKLEDYESPFDPAMLRAVDFAVKRLAETGAFKGLLPPGPYSIDGDPFEVVAGRETVLDLSGPAPLPPDLGLTPWRR